MLWLVEAFQYIYILIEFVHFEFVELSFAVGLLQLCLLVVSLPSDVVLSTICNLRVNFFFFFFLIFDCSFCNRCSWGSCV